VTDSLLQRSNIHALRFDSSNLGRWDSSLLVFLSSLREASRRRHIVFDQTGLPPAARRLLALLPAAPPESVVPVRNVGTVARVGIRAIGIWSDLIGITTLTGETILRTGAAVRGQARTRIVDLLACIQDAGIAALPMVALVNILVGGIVAFVGGIQLRRLGAEIYVADLIGVTEVREMAPLMTAIVMSGRTGSAYAAEIAAMQGSEEIDALQAIGIPVFDYLILPRAVLTENRGNFVTAPVRSGNPSDGAVVAGMADAVSQLAGSITLAAKGLPPQSNMRGAEPFR
jgi:phospholipid/cholesterol/gamma-HCH transport system permease protein